MAADPFRAYEALSENPLQADPEAIEKLREFAQQLEEKNLDVLLPEPCFVVQTESEDGDLVYINICQSKQVAEPQIVPQPNQTEGIRIPLSLSPPRTEIDHRSKPCTVYDAVMNPKALEDCDTDEDSKYFLLELVASWVEQKNNTKISRNFVFPRITKNYIGSQVELQTIRLDTKKGSKITEVNETKPAINNASRAETKSPLPFPKISEVKPSEFLSQKPANIQTVSEAEHTKVVQSEKPAQAKPVEPAFTVDTIDPEHYRVVIELPLINKASDLDVVYGETSIELNAPPHYKLQITLPNPVAHETATAKFDKKKHVLSITLEILKPRQKISPPKKKWPEIVFDSPLLTDLL